MALSAEQIAKLNGMCMNAGAAALGTAVSALETAVSGLQAGAVVSGSHEVTAGEATANEVDITTGISPVSGFIVQIFRSGVMVLGDAVVTAASGVLNIADGASTYAVTEGDVIQWIAF